MNWLVRSWYNRNIFCYFLTPFSALYRLSIFLRHQLYKLGIKKITKFSVPIIVVGNITLGGTGKTPLVIWLAKFLQKHGYRPGIVSRGYGGISDHYPQQVIAKSDPYLVSDEAVLIVQRTNCPMVVAPDRVAAVQMLLKNNDCDIVISDDGMQHYAMGRDIEIAVIDGVRRLGNEFCLPAGPLREPKQRLKKVNFIVSNGGKVGEEYKMDLIPKKIFNLMQPQQILTSEIVKDKKIRAVAGIGNPQRFFSLLDKLGYSFIPHSFPDHYYFRPQDLKFASNDIIIMTEKDAVKCRQFQDPRIWYLPIEAELEDKFAERLLISIKEKTKWLNSIFPNLKKN